MAVLQSELVIDKSTTVNDTSSNGGYRSYNEVARSSSQNFFPSVFEAMRTSGGSTLRFGYVCNQNLNMEAAQNTKIWVDNETDADDYVYFVVKDQGDTQADITGTEQLYSVANLSTDATAGDSVLVVTFPTTSSADTWNRALTSSIADGANIRVTNKQYPDSVSGTTEFKNVSGTPVVAGDQVTITLATALENSYTVAEGARVSLVYEAGTIVATHEDPIITSAGGSMDLNAVALELDNKGTIEETWTITFQDANNFTVSGARTGAITSGSRGSDYAPTNPDSSTPYLTILSGSWGGAYVNGDMVVITTHDSSENCAFNRVVPPGSGVFGTNRCTIGISCESV